MTNLKRLTFFRSLPYDRRVFVPVFLMMLALLATENVDSYVADFLTGFNTSSSGVILFAAISVGYLMGQLFVLKIIDGNIKTIRSRSKLVDYVHIAVSIIQYTLAANIIFIVFQIFVFSKYWTISLILVTSLSNLFTAFLLVIFGIRFLVWFRGKQESLVVLLYGLAFLILAFSEIMAGLSDSYLLYQRDQLVTPNSEVKFYDFPEGSFFNQFYNYYDYVDYASFFLILLATALLLHHYGRSVNKLKLLIVISLPLISYTSSLLDALNIYDTDTNPDLFSYYVFQSLSTLSGGVLFAVSFWFVSKRLPTSPIKTFLTITGIGFVLFYISNNVTVSIAPYPPFGMNSLSLLPLASYLVLSGLYSSALSLSVDTSLRKRIRSMAKNDNDFLSSIGTAQMELEIRRTIDQLKELSQKQDDEFVNIKDIITPLREGEIEDYVRQVVDEVSKSRNKKVKG
jgi:hypothetical protein